MAPPVRRCFSADFVERNGNLVPKCASCGIVGGTNYNAFQHAHNCRHFGLTPCPRLDGGRRKSRKNRRGSRKSRKNRKTRKSHRSTRRN